jgi:hypothetical protein
MDPDCIRDCGREGNCIPNCPMPDPDCVGGLSDGGAVRDGGAARDAGSPSDASVRETGAPDVQQPPADAATRDAPFADELPPEAAPPGPLDAATRDATPPIPQDAGSGSTTGGAGGESQGCSCRSAGAPVGFRAAWLLGLACFARLGRTRRSRRP